MPPLGSLNERGLFYVKESAFFKKPQDIEPNWINSTIFFVKTELYILKKLLKYIKIKQTGISLFNLEWRYTL